MAASGRPQDRPVSERLLSEGHRFDFYQAVRLLETIRKQRLEEKRSRPAGRVAGGARKMEPPPRISDTSVGESPNPYQEAILFRSRPSLAFPASDIEEIRPASGDRYEMFVNFLGLASVGGPLPFTDVEMLLERASAKDTALLEFLDIFHHRLVSLMYRTRKIFRVGFDHRPPDSSPLAAALFGILGLRGEKLRNRLPFPDRALLFYAGLFAHQSRSAAGLEQVLGDYFGTAVEVHPFAGKWRALEVDQHTRVGRWNGTNHALGAGGVVLGRRFWDQQGSFVVRFGCSNGGLSRRKFESFLPVGNTFAIATGMTRFYAGEQFDFAFQLRIGRPEAPRRGLSGRDGPRLGWTSWLKPSETGDDLMVMVSPSRAAPILPLIARLNLSDSMEVQTPVTWLPASCSMVLRAYDAERRLVGEFGKEQAAASGSVAAGQLTGEQTGRFEIEIQVPGEPQPSHSLFVDVTRAGSTKTERV